jgi:hypothetical protein
VIGDWFTACLAIVLVLVIEDGLARIRLATNSLRLAVGSQL